jgi:hypothetical protein
MSQIAASSLSRLRPVQPGQIISANLINLIIESHIELERRLQELERRREPPPPPPSGGGETNPHDTGVLVRPKDEFMRPKDEVFIRDRIESIGPTINLAEIMDTDDGPVAVITGANLHNLDSVNFGNIAVDTSKAERIGDGIRIPLKDQAEIMRAMQDTNAISSISVSAAEGMAAKSVQFGKLGRAGRIK